MNVLKELKYSDDHEWARVEGNLAYVGISDYAQHALGDIVYVELPAEGLEIAAGESLGEIESFKSTADILSPVSGKVVKVNEDLNNAPEQVNENPYDSWMVAVEMSDAAELDALMDAEAYSAFIADLD